MRPARACHSVQIRAGRHINDRHLAAALQLTSGVDAVQLAGKMDIQQHKVRPQVGEPLQGLLPGGTDADDVMTQHAERRSHVAAHEAFVFDDQDANGVGTGHFPDDLTILAEINYKRHRKYSSFL